MFYRHVCIALGLALFPFTSLADPAPLDRPYMTTITSADGHLSLEFVTKAQYSSMCRRTTTRLELRQPESPGAFGSIDFDTELDPDTVCAMAFGPHRGGVTLAIGSTLPAIASGSYRLKIDGVDYGNFYLSRNGDIDYTPIELCGVIRATSRDFNHSDYILTRDSQSIYLKITPATDASLIRKLHMLNAISDTGGANGCVQGPREPAMLDGRMTFEATSGTVDIISD